MKRLKRILAFALAQVGVISLHAQQPPPPAGASPAAPDSPGGGSKAPVAPPTAPAAALLATNVPARPMSYVEEKSARDLLRAVRIQNAQRHAPRDPFENSFTIAPPTDDVNYEVMPGRLTTGLAPVVRTPIAPTVVQPPVAQQPIQPARTFVPATAPDSAWQPDPYELELLAKARLLQTESVAEARRPAEAAAPVAPAPVVYQTATPPAAAPVPFVTPAPRQVVSTAPVALTESPESVPAVDRYIAELAEKAKALQAQNPSIDPGQPTETPNITAAPPVVTPPQPSEQERKKADEEFRRKELERIEAEVNKAAEERKKREAAAAIPTPAPAPVVVTAPPVVTPPPAPTPPPQPVAPVVVAVPASQPSEIVPMNSELESQARALLRQATREMNATAATGSPATPAAQPVPAAPTLPPASPETQVVPAASFIPPSTPKPAAIAAHETPATPKIDSEAQKQIDKELLAHRANEMRAAKEVEARAKEEARQRAYAEALRIKEEKARANEAAAAEARRIRDEQRLAASEQDKISKQKSLDERLAQIRAAKEKEETERAARAQAGLLKPAATPVAPAVIAAATPAPTPAPTAALAPAETPAIPATYSSKMSPSAEAKARALLDQKLLELGNPPPSTGAATTLPVATPGAATSLPAEEQLKAEAAARREREKAAAEAARQSLRDNQGRLETDLKASKAESRAKADSEKKAKALAEKMAREEARQSAAAEAKARDEAKKAGVASAQPRELEQPKTKPSDPIVRTWEVPGGKTKEQRLADLYDAYSRDSISPSEYHRARAKIISEP